jgi:hypothetical protein
VSAIDLEYELGSLLPPPKPGRIGTFEGWLSHFWERPVRLPAKGCSTGKAEGASRKTGARV